MLGPPGSAFAFLLKGKGELVQPCVPVVARATWPQRPEVQRWLHCGQQAHLPWLQGQNLVFPVLAHILQGAHTIEHNSIMK